VLASIADAPLVQVFSLRQQGGHYQFYGLPAVRPYRPPHHERTAHLRKCATEFAANLERIVKLDPLQWYNFFPFWERSADSLVRKTPGVDENLADKAVRAPAPRNAVAPLP